ncbi:MAG: hypothetical protein K2Q09_00680 [Phycisphaerales bacterium]|nr:hypothetical protein [Phycisphaerales bacterium]
MSTESRFTRLSLIALVAGSCLAAAPRAALADGHGGDGGAPPKNEEAKRDEPAGHGGGEAKPAYAPAPVAKGVSLKAPPEALKKEPGPTKVEAKPEPKAVKSATNFKPAPKPVAKAGAAVEDASVETARTADEALALLREGNQRWLDGSVQNPSSGVLRRKTTAESGQRPFAVVLTCADSRIPVERVFDRGVGEVFVARVAGNVNGPHESGTIEYAAEHLNVPLLVVMGHSKCGAVKATAEGGQVSPNIASLVESIKPAVERAKKLNPSLEGAELVEAAVRENVWQSVFDLYKSSPTVVEMVRAGRLKVVGAVLDISSGKVDWMGEHPWQEAIVGAFSTRSAEPAGEASARGGLKTADAEPKGH